MSGASVGAFPLQHRGGFQGLDEGFAVVIEVVELELAVEREAELGAGKERLGGEDDEG